MNNNSGGMNIMYKLHVIIVLCLSFYLKFSYLKIIFVDKINQRNMHVSYVLAMY